MAHRRKPPPCSPSRGEIEAPSLLPLKGRD